MRKVLIYSLLLIAGMVFSQVVPPFLGGAAHAYHQVIEFITMVALAFIMIHVGYEFEIDKKDLKQYGIDYGVAASAATVPWLLCAFYFMFVMMPRPLWTNLETWKETLLASCFSAPTSAGVLFAMLAAAGLATTWMFQKARILAIFDDLFAILLLIPLKIMIVGLKWQLGLIIMIIGVQLWVAWRFIHQIRLPHRWRWVLGYSVALVLFCRGVYIGSQEIDELTPIQIEVLLPAFVIGCVMARPPGADPHRDDAEEGHEQGPETPTEQRVATLVSAAFMVLVGLSMPLLESGPPNAVVVAELAQRYPGVPAGVLEQRFVFPGWGMIAVHTLMVTLLSNLGKMVPYYCYPDRTKRERLALAIGMFPRGEVGAGVLVLSLSFGIRGPMLTVALLSLALNLILTGVFILLVKQLLRPAVMPSPGAPEPVAG